MKCVVEWVVLGVEEARMDHDCLWQGYGLGCCLCLWCQVFELCCGDQIV